MFIKKMYFYFPGVELRNSTYLKIVIKLGKREIDLSAFLFFFIYSFSTVPHFQPKEGENSD